MIVIMRKLNVKMIGHLGGAPGIAGDADGVDVSDEIARILAANVKHEQTLKLTSNMFTELHYISKFLRYN